MSAFERWKAQQPAPQQQTIGESKPMINENTENDQSAVREASLSAPAGSRNDVQAWSNRASGIVVHKQCAHAYTQEPHPKNLDVFIHDRRSEYLGRFECCYHCRKAI